MVEKGQSKMVGKWYFGGVASAMAACCTHPLDLLKVSEVRPRVATRIQDTIAKSLKQYLALDHCGRSW